MNQLLIVPKKISKIYHQQGAQITKVIKTLNFIFGENNNYHQIGNGYLKFDITVRKNDNTNFHYDDAIPLVNNGFAYYFKGARLSFTIGSDIEHNNFCDQVSTIMKLISNKDGHILSQVDNNNENDIPILQRLADLPPQIRDTPQQKMVINNHTDANKSKIKRYLYVKDKFGFCKSFKKVTKILGFHIMLKRDNLQNIIYTSMADDINVTFYNCICMYQI